MFRNRLYYRLKPLLPASLRLAVRRWFAKRKREQVLGTWPILPGSEKPPANWAGWPDGKQFAFVLTHDVEGPAGLAKCRHLMDLEMRLGFRSSFNFIPEGDYTVPRSLIDELKANGFEVGIHDLHHDGKLYTNRQDFAQKAVRINHYMKEWGAVGFRSGFMLHNLEWLHDLEVAYDASTFDTDPFEPQPDGVNTIFPFWVEKGKAESGKQKRDLTSDLRPLVSGLRPPSSGYVELLMRERHPDIWFQKLDWVARHGGMALLDTHPDFMGMNGELTTGSEYPLAHYEALLQYIGSGYKGAYWHVLPKEIATYWTNGALKPCTLHAS